MREFLNDVHPIYSQEAFDLVFLIIIIIFCNALSFYDVRNEDFVQKRVFCPSCLS